MIFSRQQRVPARVHCSRGSWRPRPHRAIAAAVSAVVVTALGVIPAASAAPASPAGADATATATTAAATSPYGNPYTSYLRQPFGVLPQGEEGTPPVTDNPSEPFDWYRTPWAALGVFGGVQETSITPQGFLQSDFGTLQFDTGSSLTPMNQRVKTWKDGWLPVAEYTYPSGGASYHVEAFDTTVPGVTTIPVSQTYGVGSRQTTASASVANIITYARVTVTNTTDAAGTFTLGIGLNGQPVTNPVYRGAPMPSDLSYDPASQALTGTGADGSSEAALAVSSPPTASVGGSDHTLSYQMTLAPKASRSVTVMLPYWMAQASDVAPIQQASYSGELAATQRFWTRELASAGHVSVPESKVTDSYKASIVALLLGALGIIGNYWFTVGNPTVYNSVFLRDSAYHIEALLDAGFPDVVKHILQSYPAWQDPVSGRYEGAQATEYDSNGEALWAISQYLQVTHDTAFAKSILPSVQASEAWEWAYRQAAWPTSHGLYPVNEIADDEQVEGHIVGFDLWAISGDQGAVTVAQMAGDSSDASTWQQRTTQFAAILRQQLQPAFRQLGVVPPATEGINATGLVSGWYGNVYGIDWGNLGLVWPSGVFSASDPMVTSSLKTWQKQEFEGIFTYPSSGDEDLLHSYAPLSIPETYTRAGDQLEAVQYLYNTLVHTSAMDMTAEGMDASGRWGWSPGDQTQPHNEFSAEYASLVHDMLAYAGPANTLDLASVYSPDWTRPGQKISFSGPTAFGSAAYTITMGHGGMTMQLTPPTRNKPSSIVVHTPEKTRVTAVTGAPGARATGNTITLPALPGPVTLHVQWTVTAATPGYSYTRAVSDYLTDYHQMTTAPSVSVQNVAVSAGTSGKGSGSKSSGRKTASGKTASSSSSSSSSASVAEGDPVQTSATLVNTGGAGRLADPSVSVYTDGSATATDSTTLANGIGFNTPASVISFSHTTEGRVPVSFSQTVCGVGSHQVSVGLGGQDPAPSASLQVTSRSASGAAPPASLSFASTQPLVTGVPGTVTATFTGNACLPVTGTTVTLSAPAGWTVTPSGPVSVGDVGAGAASQLTWQVVAPPGSGAAGSSQATLTATASYGWSGSQAGQASASTPVQVLTPYATIADAYNNVGITDDSDPTPGGFDNNGGSGGDSFSAEALAQVGLTPGGTFTADGLSFTWPDAAAGTNDNLAGQAAVALPGSGDTLGIIGDGIGTQTGTGTVYYTDGTAQPFTVTFPNWAVTAACCGAEEVVNAPYRNTQSGPADAGDGYRVFYAGVPLDPGKTVADVLLPDNSAIHTWTMAIGNQTPTPVYASLSQGFNNVGITDDADPAPGNIDGAGDSFSAEALAQVGLVPGQPFTAGGLTFTWPDAAAGTDDNLALNGPAGIEISGTGNTLGIVGDGVFNQTDDVTVYYTDGTVAQSTITFPNWAVTPACCGAAEVVNAPYRNTPSGPADNGAGYRIFYYPVALQAGKTVQKVVFGVNADVHLWALAIGDSSASSP